MKIIFIGSQKIGYKILEFLIREKEQIEIIYTMKPDLHETWEYSVFNLGKKYLIETIIPTNKKMTNEISKIKEKQPDLILVLGWRWLIDKKLINIPKKGIIGIHCTLLPKYRGFAPFTWPIIFGEKKTGVTIFYLDGDMDTGDIISQESIDILSTDTGRTLRENAINMAIELFKKTYKNIKEGTATRTPQNHSQAIIVPMRIPEDGLIKWNDTSKNIINYIRALTKPYTGAFTYINDKKMIIWDAEQLENYPKYKGISGQIGKIIKNKGVVVITSDNAILLKRVQIDGEEIKSADQVITSLRIRLRNHIRLG